MSKFAILAALFAPTAALAGTTYKVCPSGCDFATIQDAVDGVSSGDTLHLSSHAFLESVVVDKTLKLVGTGSTTIDADGAAVTVEVAQGVVLTLEDLNITGADGTAGLVNYGDVHLYTVYVAANEGTYGGLVNWGAMSVDDHSVVQNNMSSSYFAGGLNNVAGTLSVSDTTFLANEGWNGGALANLSGTVTIESVSFTANDAYLGGGLHNSFGTTTITNSNFSSNHAVAVGGGYSNHNLGGCVALSNVGFAGNSTGSGQFVDSYDVGCP